MGDSTPQKFGSGAQGKAISTDRANVEGSFFIRKATIRGQFHLVAMRIGGELDCKESRFLARPLHVYSHWMPEIAVFADSIIINGSLNFSRGSIEGQVRLSGGKIGGSVNFSNTILCAGINRLTGETYAVLAHRLEVVGLVSFGRAHVRGELSFIGMRAGNDFICNGLVILALQYDSRHFACSLGLSRVDIRGEISFDNYSSFFGIIDLRGAQVLTISDLGYRRPDETIILLEGCSYKALTGAPLNAEFRLHWMEFEGSGREGLDFAPQPYEQLAKVLREMGHGEDARLVLIEKERRQRAARRGRAEPMPRALLWAWDTLLGATVRYGRQPLWAFIWLGAFLVLGLLVFRSAEAADALKPNAVVVLRSAEWAGCVDGGERRAAADASQLACFERQPEARGYPRFNALVYSADTLLPIVSLEMQGFWIPDETVPHGRWARVYLWIHIAVGWALSLLAVAGFSGLVKSD